MNALRQAQDHYIPGRSHNYWGADSDRPHALSIMPSYQQAAHMFCVSIIFGAPESSKNSSGAAAGPPPKRCLTTYAMPCLAESSPLVSEGTQISSSRLIDMPTQNLVRAAPNQQRQQEGQPGRLSERQPEIQPKQQPERKPRTAARKAARSRRAARTAAT